MIAARARVRVIDPREMMASRGSNQAVSRLTEYLDRIEDSREPIIGYLLDCLDKMDEKLERILDVVDGERLKKERLVKQTIDISGSGISLVLQGPIEKGQILDISLAVPGFPMGRFDVYGEVIHTRPHPGSESGYWEVGVKFIKMALEQREALIACAFRQQRKMIRRNKETPVTEE
ncbi:MAG: PilZ domain-containing protein [Thermodesulfobacteriota bacterium]